MQQGEKGKETMSNDKTKETKTPEEMAAEAAAKEREKEQKDQAERNAAKKVAEEDAKAKGWEKKADDVQCERVFRQLLPRKMRNRTLITLQNEKTIVDGTEIPARCVSLRPNHANQYVLSEGAIEYAKQLKALRHFENKGEIIEVDPKSKGTPYVSKAEKELAEIERRRAELLKEVGAE